MEEPKKSFGPLVAMIVLLALAMGNIGCVSAAPRRLGEPIASPAVNASGNPVVTSEPQGQVTIYGVEWCGPCHQAADFLSKRGIHYVERNIEGDEQAQQEMKSKLDRAGLRAGTIPIIDVKGMILVGFSPHAVDRALRRASEVERRHTRSM